VAHLEANLSALLGALHKARPAAAKGKYFKALTLSSTMGPGVPVEIGAAQAMAEGKAPPT